MRILSCLLLFVLGCGASAPYVTEAPPVDALPTALHSTVLVTEGGGLCSGVIVQQVILTAAHCISVDGQGIQVAFFDPTMPENVGKLQDAVVAKLDRDQDLAVLLLASGDLPIGISLAPSNLDWGRPVVSIGHPLGLYFTITTGVVSNPSRWLKGRHVLQISSPTTFGNSGGPVFNGYGELVGINSFMLAQQDFSGDYTPTNHLGMAVHLDEIRRFLKQ